MHIIRRSREVLGIKACRCGGEQRPNGEAHIVRLKAHLPVAVTVRWRW